MLLSPDDELNKERQTKEHAEAALAAMQIALKQAKSELENIYRNKWDWSENDIASELSYISAALSNPSATAAARRIEAMQAVCEAVEEYRGYCHRPECECHMCKTLAKLAALDGGKQ
jgi:hypothetical protein